MDSPPVSSSPDHVKHSSNGSRRRRTSRKGTTRDGSRNGHHHHHHRGSKRKRRHHHSHAHSLSKSPPEQRTPVVYMNPAFQQVCPSPWTPGMSPLPGTPGVPGSVMSPTSGVLGVGPMHGASGLPGVPPTPAPVIDYEMLASLQSQLSAREQRISCLESELTTAQLARGRAEQNLHDVSVEKLRLEAHANELMQVMKSLERGVEELQRQVNGHKADAEYKKREIENLEKSLSSCREQSAFLNDRNLKLVKKCEQLTCENRAILKRRDESIRELADVKPRIDELQAELRQRSDENWKILALVRNFEEKERCWKKEKADLEKKIEIKNAVATAERKNNEEWKRKQLEERAELERKLKLATPEVTRALTAEEIVKSIEDVRAYYETKVNKMIAEMENLKRMGRRPKTRFVRKAKAVPTTSRVSADEEFPQAVTPSTSSTSACWSNSEAPLSCNNGVVELTTDNRMSDE